MDNTTELWITKYIIGEIFSSGRANLYKNHSDQTVTTYLFQEKAAEANEKLYTDKYVQLETSKYLSTNTKFYFSGETSPLGALLSKLIPN